MSDTPADGSHWSAPTITDWLDELHFRELAGIVAPVDGDPRPANLLYLHHKCPRGLHPWLDDCPAKPVLVEFIRTEYGATPSPESVGKMVQTIRARTGRTTRGVLRRTLGDAAKDLGLTVPHIAPDSFKEGVAASIPSSGSADTAPTRTKHKRRRKRAARIPQLLIALLEDDRRKAHLDGDKLAHELHCHPSSISRAFRHPEYGPRLSRLYNDLGAKPPTIGQI
jgi:hypothetical protein